VGAPGVICEVREGGWRAGDWEPGGGGDRGGGGRGVRKDSVGFSEERKEETAWRTRDSGRVPGAVREDGRAETVGGGGVRLLCSFQLSRSRVASRTANISDFSVRCQLRRAGLLAR
jgi:hypothetical protein